MRITFTVDRNNDVTVHKAGCLDIGRWESRGVYGAEVDSRQDAANEWWSDLIPDEMSEADAFESTHFAPCVRSLP